MKKTHAFYLVPFFLFFAHPAYAVCTFPDGVEGEIVYNKDAQKPQYCDGSNWIGIGWKGAPAGRPAGANGDIQFAQDGELAATSAFNWNNANTFLEIRSPSNEWPIRIRLDRADGKFRNQFLAVRSLNGAPVTTNTHLGGISMGGFDGTNYSFGWNGGAEIAAHAAQNFTPTNRGAYLTFNTTPNDTIAILERMRITERGFVGINTQTPYNALHVQGNIGATGWVGAGCETACSDVETGYAILYPDGRIQITSNAYKPGGGAWLAPSDARLKHVDGPYAQGLPQINALKTVRYHYTPNNPRKMPSDTEYVGLIAQDVAPIFPEAVSQGEDGYYNLDQTPIIYALINAVQELSAKVEKLEKEAADNAKR